MRQDPGHQVPWEGRACSDQRYEEGGARLPAAVSWTAPLMQQLHYKQRAHVSCSMMPFVLLMQPYRNWVDAAEQSQPARLLAVDVLTHCACCASAVPAGVPSNALYSVTWSPDCSLLAASSAGGAVYLFDYAKGIALKKWQLHDKPSLKVLVCALPHTAKTHLILHTMKHLPSLTVSIALRTQKA